MKILLDTHIFLWSLGDTRKLSEKRLSELRSQANIIYLSSISIAELMIKCSIGKLKIDYDIIKMVKESDFKILDFKAEDAVLLKSLPFHHKDPFDRMLICQSKTNKMKLMTDDQKIKLYDCKVI